MRGGQNIGDSDHHVGMLGPLTREVGRGLAARTSLLAVPTAAGGPLDVIAAWSAVPPWDATRPPDGESFVGRARRTPGVHLGPVAAGDDSLGRPHDGPPVIFGAAAHVRPYRAPGGLLCAGFTADPAGDPSRIRWVLDAYARVASLCVAAPDAVDGLVLAARYDGTTGCLNQSAIHDELEREVQRAERHPRGLVCCFVDLDRFKQVNDRLGHLEGTRVLQRVAATLRSGLRTTDVLGRFGGDEFVLILPDCTREGGLDLTRRLRALLAVPGATTPHGEPPVGVSFGVAEWTPGMFAEELLHAADTALLSAKRRGGGVSAAVEIASLDGATHH
jgi:diguanylate cyclase (GGDEF)-like protein